MGTWYLSQSESNTFALSATCKCMVRPPVIHVHLASMPCSNTICSNVVSTFQNAMIIGADYYESDEQRKKVLAAGGVPLGIGAGTTIKNCIVDKNARIGKNVTIENKKGVEVRCLECSKVSCCPSQGQLRTGSGVEHNVESNCAQPIRHTCHPAMSQLSSHSLPYQPASCIGAPLTLNGSIRRYGTGVSTVGSVALTRRTYSASRLRMASSSTPELVMQ